METLRYILLANGLLAVVSLAYYVLLRRETFFGANRLALWAGLVASLGLPLLELPDWRPQPVKMVMQRTAQVIVPKVLPGSLALLPGPDAATILPGNDPYPAMQQPAFVWSWQAWLLRVYGAGVLLLLIRFSFQLASLNRLIRQSVHEPYDDFTLVRNRHITSPFSFFGWVVLNPDDHEPDELDQILRHERVHVRERHSLDMIAAELICVALWFNPAAYLFRFLLHQTLEFGADRAVLAEGVDVKAYQYNLVKVSLAGGRSSLTNHFSMSQLKSRIIMLNKPESSRTTWLKYPVLGIATLMVVATFARPSAQTLKRYVPAPVAETIAAVMKSEPVALPEQVAKPKTTEAVIDSLLKSKASIQPTAVQSDTLANVPTPDSARLSPSRYMIYRGNYLYWIVTPKTTFDDFVVMKQEFAKYGHQMQLMEVKYDPLYTYIDRVIFKVVRRTGGMTQVDEIEDDNKPIPTVAGYVGTGSKASESDTGALRYYGKEFPDELRAIAVGDSLVVTKHIVENSMEYLMHAGDKKFNYLGGASSTFKKDNSNKAIHNRSGLTVQPDGSLSINEKLGTVKVFINNEPALHDAVRQLTINQLYSVVSKISHNPATKEQFTSALLIYVNENN